MTVGFGSGELTEEMIEAVKAQLPETDGEPLETPWHRAEINLLIESVKCHRRGRTDYYAGGNMFIYYSRRQARTREYRGPDFFVVNNTDGTRVREVWWVFEEDGRFPDVIVELLSRSTAEEDRTTKKDLYEQRFRTAEYFCYDPYEQRLEGWRLVNGRYQSIEPDAQGRLWSEQLGLWLAPWEGTYLDEQAVWLRFFDADGRLVAIRAEEERQRAEEERRRAEEEHQRAEEEHQRAEEERRRAEEERRRADALETEIARLKALLMEKGFPPSGT